MKVIFKHIGHIIGMPCRGLSSATPDEAAADDGSKGIASGSHDSDEPGQPTRKKLKGDPERGVMCLQDRHFSQWRGALFTQPHLRRRLDRIIQRAQAKVAAKESALSAKAQAKEAKEKAREEKREGKVLAAARRIEEKSRKEEEKAERKALGPVRTIPRTKAVGSECSNCCVPFAGQGDEGDDENEGSNWQRCENCLGQGKVDDWKSSRVWCPNEDCQANFQFHTVRCLAQRKINEAIHQQKVAGASSGGGGVGTRASRKYLGCSDMFCID